MPRGRPVTHLKKRDVMLIVKKEIEKAMNRLEVKVVLLGTKQAGRPMVVKSNRQK